MTKGRTSLIVGSLVLVLGTITTIALYYTRSDDPEVDVERVTRRILEATVSASGTIEPELSVDISSSVMGRVTRLAVNEGDRVTATQFLLEIDPESLLAAVNRGQASLGATESGLEQARVSVETARVNLELARDNLKRQQELWELSLVSREIYDQARTEVELRETEFRARQVEVTTATQRIRQERATLDSAEHDLTQVTITSPIDGIVTRRNIEEGETVVIGTMNNAGTVLLTIADFSILEAHVEVDETDIPSVRLGQPAEITIDALPDNTYYGVVTEIGNSPIQDAGQQGTQATNFRVVVTLNGNVPGVRPGFTATADITTATRTDAIAVPIQATTVREVGFNSDSSLGLANPSGNSTESTSLWTSGTETFSSAIQAQPGNEPNNVLPISEEMDEVEGVFIIRDRRVSFVRVDTGIAGERYFEVLSGLNSGDLVVTGPFDVVRTLQDGDAVQVNERSSRR